MVTSIGVELDERADGLVVEVQGVVDLATAPTLEDALGGLDPKRGTVVVDLSGVTFIGSSGLNVLLSCRQRFESEGHGERLRLVVTSATTGRVFEATGLSSIFRICASADEALADA